MIVIEFLASAALTGACAYYALGFVFRMLNH